MSDEKYFGPPTSHRGRHERGDPPSVDERKEPSRRRVIVTHSPTDRSIGPRTHTFNGVGLSLSVRSRRIPRPPRYLFGKENIPMKNTPKKPVRDPLAQKILTTLKKRGVRCGYGGEITTIRKSK